jgi:hypothetical protein
MLKPSSANVSVKRKLTSMKNVYICESQLVANGFPQVQCVDYPETFSQLAEVGIKKILMLRGARQRECKKFLAKSKFYKGFHHIEGARALLVTPASFLS